MIRAYSKRLLPPYSGQVQIAESDKARALTLDGRNWEIQFLQSDNTGQMREQNRHDHSIRRDYIRVAMIENGEIQRFPVPSLLDIESIDERIMELTDYLAGSSLPFPATDHYEFWLLDAKDDSPLALIYSCTRQEDIPTYPYRPEWTALPAAMMEIERTPEEQQVYVPPVNYRLERLVAKRAGQRPRATWFNRKRVGDTDGFPPCLVSEEWEDENHSNLCQRYIKRQAPRLLMLHGLAHADRKRLEIAAKTQALEVERFYPLYPQIIDSDLMSAIRVEATFRKAKHNTSS